MSKPTCMECGKSATLVTGRIIYPHRPDLYSKFFWRCDCGAYCGCHPGGKKPLGSPCGPRTRKARSAAHRAFDPYWKGRTMSRRKAYARLAKLMNIDPKKCHIGMMTEGQALQVVKLCERGLS